MQLVAGSPAELARHDLGRTIERAFGARLVSQRLVGEGAFGVVHMAAIDRSPHRVIVKVQKFGGWVAHERRSLEALRRALPVPVPEVYHCEPANDASPGDALVLEYLPDVTGKAIGEPARLDDETRGTVREAVVEVLLALRSVRSERGNGQLDGPFHGRWWDAYAPRLRAVHAFLQRDRVRGAGLDPFVTAVADRSLRLGERVLCDRLDAATLMHGDLCLGNILFDPRTLRITGVIDLLDTAWVDPELDLVHLTKSGGHHFRFVEAYAEACGADERLRLRCWFHTFWTWLSYYARIDLRAMDWYVTCAKRLARLLDEWFPESAVADARR
jgi:aminoglycoside phosphotransferase (APT) family kinase protein